MDSVRDSIRDCNHERAPFGIPFGMLIPSGRLSGFHSGIDYRTGFSRDSIREYISDWFPVPGGGGNNWTPNVSPVLEYILEWCFAPKYTSARNPRARIEPRLEPHVIAHFLANSTVIPIGASISSSFVNWFTSQNHKHRRKRPNMD